MKHKYKIHSGLTQSHWNVTRFKLLSVNFEDTQRQGLG